MEKEKKNSSLKAIIVVLAILLVGSLVIMYKMNTDSEADKKIISEKETLVTDLEAELNSATANYETAVAENSSLQADFEAQRAEIEELLDKVKKGEADVAALQRYKKSFFKLKKAKENLEAENKMLKEQNEALTVERDSTMNVLGESRKYNDTLVSQNDNLSRTLEKASELTLLNLKVEPFKERSSGKLIATDKARRVDVLKISFTIAANQVAMSGNKTYYVQVIDSKNNVLGEAQKQMFGDYELTYSFITNAIYDNETIEVSEMLSGSDFEKGTYFVNLFQGSEMVANSTFSLR
ncbi:MAG: hypothetical protein BM557_00355 [Flavobacterium sp. MedPE-SWcel]|uniref:hypothetical protein n=1 Tax=uncultured Flavobacterium sp. TaxID=165435 RepID=UPI00091AC92E|nr:hypothetical protein [uncultured Flavobacterium sp.]OIQ22473.1 MAG: hypothetical protein BM557_00355 [Flavobacterium sp. MedPE-SWcel]